MPPNSDDITQLIWPPAPTLGPPSHAFRSKLPSLWVVVAINLGGSGLYATARIIEQWYKDRPVIWQSDAQEGLWMFATLMSVQLIVRYVVRRQEAEAAQKSVEK